MNATPVGTEHGGFGSRGPAACRTCRHFADAGPELEDRLPGLPALGSVYGSVRGADGLCRLHDRYLAATSSCARYERCAPPDRRR